MSESWSTADLKVTVEVNGQRIVIEGDQFDDFSLSIPSDVHTDADGRRELGRTHVVLVGILKEDVRPLWEETHE
jgi:hypothetical protein